MLVGHRHGGLPPEGRGAHQHLVEDHPQRIEIGAYISRVALRLLGTEIGGRADHRPGLGQVGGLIPNPGYPEVGHLHRAVRVEHDISRLDVSVDHPQTVGYGQGQNHLPGDLHGPAGRHGHSLLGDVAQAIPLHQLHHHEIRAVRLPPVVDAHDVGMVQVGGGLGLPSEPANEGLVLTVGAGKDFDRHPPAQGQIHRQIHIGHASLGQVAHQSVAIGQGVGKFHLQGR